MPSSLVTFRPIRLIFSTIVFLVVFFVFATGVHAAAVSCPATDGGAGDDDATADGTITINTDKTWSATTGYAADGDYWDCTGNDLLITSNATLTFEGDTVNGYHPYLKVDNLQIDSGSTISGNEEGCEGDNDDGQGPNGSNVCTNATAGYGAGQNSGGYGGGGAGYGSEGGEGTNKEEGTFYGSSTAPTLFGSSGGGVEANTGKGGTGGGVVHLELTGTLTHNGSISADGGDGGYFGTGRVAGGGSGGSIYIVTGTISGSGTFSATGGDGADGTTQDGGGGSGGRISINYTTSSFSFDSSDFDVSGGSGPDAAEDGAKGSVFVEETDANIVNIYHGFTYDDTDYSETTWTIDTTATSQHCLAGTSTPSISATNLTLAGTIDCEAAITSFNFSATSDFSLSSGASFTIADAGADVDFTIPAADNQTWTNFTFNGAPEGSFTIDDAISIELAGTSAINSNVSWTNLTGLTIGSSSSIVADGMGCQASATGDYDGFGPDGSNVCAQDGSGYGDGINNTQGAQGGSHGGQGGAGEVLSSGGTVYGEVTAPVLFGASGGSNGTSDIGGAGGGTVRLSLSSGTFTHNGSIKANGLAGQNDIQVTTGARAAGGGAGGSIYVTAQTLDGSTGTFQANGGNGVDDSSEDAGGGGGGRIAITHTGGTFGFDSSDFTVTGGTAGFNATAGSKGTVYVKNTSTSAVSVFHGFSFDDTDYSETSWTMDSSATNQYCFSGTSTPSISAGTLVLGGTINCSASITSFNFSATSSFDVVSGTSLSVTDSGATVDFTIPDGDNQTWTNFTFDGANQGAFTIDDAVSIELAGTSNVGANINWTNLTGLTTGASSVIHADGKGCTWSATGTFDGFGPTALNVCTQTTAGYGDGQNASFTGGGGGAYGGAGGTGDSSSLDLVGGTPYGDATAPTLYGSSGGGLLADSPGGTGGGTVRLGLASGTFTHNGVLRSNGDVPVDTGASGRAGGGGSGGAIYVTAQALAGSTGTFVANGADGFDDASADGGGGGGGRIALTYTSDALSLDSSDFSVNGGTGPGLATDGATGTVYTKNTASDSVTLYHGFSFDDTDYSVTGTWASDSSATNQYCLSGTTTPSVSAATISFGGTLNCTESVTSFNWSASSAFTVSSGSNMTISAKGADVDFTLPSDTTFSNFTFVGGNQGAFTIDDAVGITLSSSTSITANVDWTNLTSFTSDNGTTISANALGCTADSNEDGYGPDGSNVCTISTAGYGDGQNITNYGAGGGGHGGAGGAGSDGVASATHGSETAPVLYGASGGDGAGDTEGGAGGGTVRIQVTNGTFTHNGAITADGGAGTDNGTSRAAGGGSGGSIYLSAQCDYAGSTGTLSADGGDGGDSPGVDHGGGGGGGRVRVGYGTNSSSILTSFTASGVAAGGTGPDIADDGADGTLSTADAFGPCVGSSLTRDNDSDGQIDQVVLTLTEDVDAGTVAGADFTVAGYTVASASRTDTNEVTVVLTESGSLDTGATPALTIAGSIADGSGNTTTSGSSTPTDAVAPRPVALSYKDTNGDGQVDRIDSTFSETIGLDECETSDYVVGGADAGSIAVSACGTSGNDLQLTIINAPANDTNLTLTAAYTAANGTSNSLDDAAGNAVADIAATAVSDAAAPVKISQAYKDTDANGTVDRFDVVFSENIAFDECEAGDYTIGGADAGSIAVSSCAVSGTDLRLSVSNAPANETNLTVTLGYLQAGGTGNSLDDASGNAVTDILSASLDDAAGPVLVSLTPSNGAEDQVAAVSIVGTFSESINIGSAAYTLTETPSDLSAVWSESNTVYTLSTTEGYTAGDTITFTMTAAPDAAANTLAGANSTAFTIVAASGGSSTATVTFLSPNGGEVLTVGDDVTLKWTWSGGTSSSRTQLWLSIDGGSSYSLIDDFYASGVGEYDWEVTDAVTDEALMKVIRAESSFVVEDVSNQVFTIQAATVDEEATGADEDVTNEDASETEEVNVILFEDAYVSEGALVIPSEARSPYSGLVEPVNQNLEIGDLITSYSYPAVYYIDEQAKRRPFVNEETYFTYYDSFDEVKLVTDATLDVFGLGEPMLPKAGAVLVKLQSDPRVYALDETEEGTALRWIPDEEVANNLYGDAWSSYVLDLPVFLFPRFEQGTIVQSDESVDLTELKQRDKLTGRKEAKYAL